MTASQNVTTCLVAQEQKEIISFNVSKPVTSGSIIATKQTQAALPTTKAQRVAVQRPVRQPHPPQALELTKAHQARQLGPTRLLIHQRLPGLTKDPPVVAQPQLRKAAAVSTDWLPPVNTVRASLRRTTRTEKSYKSSATTQLWCYTAARRNVTPAANRCKPSTEYWRETLTCYRRTAGQQTTSPRRRTMSAYPPRADIRQGPCARPFCAKSGHWNREKASFNRA